MHAIRWGAAGLALFMLLAPAQAEPDYVRIQAEGPRILALYDGYVSLPASIFGAVPEAEVRARYVQAHLDADRGAETPIMAYLIDDGKTQILIDAGSADSFGPNAGRLMSSLRAAGYRPEDIDDILITHMHPDHVCGLITPSGKPAFPAATVWASEAEASHWLAAPNKNVSNAAKNTAATDRLAAGQSDETTAYLAKTASRALAPYRRSGHLRTFTPDTEVLPGIRALADAGHTPGHTAYLLTGAQILFWGDTVHVAALQFLHPEATYAYDTDPAQAVESRKRLLRLAAEKGWRVAGAHLPFPGFGHVVRNGDRYDWLPESASDGASPSSP